MVDELYFKFGEYDSRCSRSLVVTELPPLLLHFNHFDIEELEGRDGYLTYDYDCRKTVYKTIEVKALNDDLVKELRRYLRRPDFLELSNDLGTLYKARLESITEGVGEFPQFRTFKLVFICQPNGFDKTSMHLASVGASSSISGTERQYIKHYKRGNYFKGLPLIQFTLNSTSFKLRIENIDEITREKTIDELEVKELSSGSKVEIDTILKNVRVNNSYPAWYGSLGAFSGDDAILRISVPSPGNIANLKIAERWAI